jgi:hypothetical protein
LFIEFVHTFCRTFARHTATMIFLNLVSTSICAFFHTLTPSFWFAILIITHSMSLLHTHFSIIFTSESSIKCYGSLRLQSLFIQIWWNHDCIIWMDNLYFLREKYIFSLLSTFPEHIMPWSVSVLLVFLDQVHL